MRACVLLALVAAGVAGGELPPGVVARVGPQDITIGELTRALLAREGADALVEWVRGHVEALDWGALPDEAVVMRVAGHELRKRELVAMLIASKGAKAREELIDIAVVEQALARAGIAIDDALLAATYRVMERDFQRRLRQQGQGYVDFASWLRVKQQQTVEQFLAQPAIRMLAGLHALVRRELAAEWDDRRLQAKLDAERARWDQRAGVDLAVIHLPWRRDAEGRISDEERLRLQGVANLIHRQLARGEVGFAQAWEAFGKAWDASGPGGRIGWVDAEGRREGDEEARRIPRALVQRAFAAEPPWPRLLPPVVHEGGVDIAEVWGKRPARAVTLAEVRGRMLDELFEQQVEERTKALIARLRREASIAYGSLPEALR